ncbi:MAG: TetR family transcriptional regulator [Clostridiales bacterium]|jgi:AcrR family transcriptional regulator|nr:TetR family transcriptional regulator [Clostridiales bacterium]
MGRNEESNQKIRDERKDQILNAALKIFARKGIGSTKVSDIASAAGVSHGLVYQHFRSKEEIFEILVENAMELTKQAAEVISKIPVSPINRIKTYFESFIQDLERQRQEGDYPYYFLIMIQATSFETISERVVEILNAQPFPLGTFFFDTIIEGQKLGEIVQEDPMMLTSTLLQLSLGIALCSTPGKNPMPTPDIHTILKMLKP